MKKRDQKYEEFKTKRESINAKQVYEEASQYLDKAIMDKFKISKDTAI